MYILSKLTEPSWDKILSDLNEVKSVLCDNICDICLRELNTEFDINDLLNTRCGEEFRVEEFCVNIDYFKTDDSVSDLLKKVFGEFSYRETCYTK